MQRDERETVIRIGHGVDEVSIYSTERGVWRKCERAGWRLEGSDSFGRSYVGSILCFSFTARSRESREKLRSRLSRHGRRVGFRKSTAGGLHG